MVLRKTVGSRGEINPGKSHGKGRNYRDQPFTKRELVGLSLVTNYARKLGEELSLGRWWKSFIRSFVQEVQVTGSEATIRSTARTMRETNPQKFFRLSTVVCGSGLEPLTSWVSSIATTLSYSKFLHNKVRTCPYMSVVMYAELVKK